MIKVAWYYNDNVQSVVKQKKEATSVGRRCGARKAWSRAKVAKSRPSYCCEGEVYGKLNASQDEARWSKRRQICEGCKELWELFSSEATVGPIALLTGNDVFQVIGEMKFGKANGPIVVPTWKTLNGQTINWLTRIRTTDH
ncbi:unnamed protein product [Haemonchus placei]|uniref:SCP domain-containing protein n=1 Tax=Haemonchus placei TaxID=6290 RepID=A0A0N4VS09_HAEPC|nr:unnamed protein product [Haemonchus placei]